MRYLIRVDGERLPVHLIRVSGLGQAGRLQREMMCLVPVAGVLDHHNVKGSSCREAGEQGRLKRADTRRRLHLGTDNLVGDMDLVADNLSSVRAAGVISRSSEM
jgi:hypothetical protein